MHYSHCLQINSIIDTSITVTNEQFSTAKTLTTMKHGRPHEQSTSVSTVLIGCWIAGTFYQVHSTLHKDGCVQWKSLQVAYRYAPWRLTSRHAEIWLEPCSWRCASVICSLSRSGVMTSWSRDAWLTPRHWHWRWLAVDLTFPLLVNVVWGLPAGVEMLNWRLPPGRDRRRRSDTMRQCSNNIPRKGQTPTSKGTPRSSTNISQPDFAIFRRVFPHFAVKSRINNRQ